MKTPALPIVGGAVALLALLFSGCASTDVTTVSPAAPPPPEVIVRVNGTVNRSEPEMRRFALATETRHRANSATEQALFDSVRRALEDKGYAYVSSVEDADMAVFVNYGFSPAIARSFDSRDLTVVERKVEVTRYQGSPNSPATVVTTTTTTPAEEISTAGLQTAYVDLVAYNQKSLKRDTLWETHIEGVGWSVSKVHDLPRLVDSSRNLISRTTNGTARIELR
jgi:hypothetical protein